MTCTKVTYETQAEARKTLTRLIRVRALNLHNEFMEDHAYRCPSCRLWHLTSRPLCGGERKPISA